MTKGSAAIDEISAVLARLVEGLKKLSTAEDWVDQRTSPLGKRAHLAAVRSGDLVGHKVGHLVLVRRDEIDAFISRHRVKVASAQEREDEQREIDELVRPKALPIRKRRTA